MTDSFEADFGLAMFGYALNMKTTIIKTQYMKYDDSIGNVRFTSDNLFYILLTA